MTPPQPETTAEQSRWWTKSPVNDNVTDAARQGCAELTSVATESWMCRCSSARLICSAASLALGPTPSVLEPATDKVFLADSHTRFQWPLRVALGALVGAGESVVSSAALISSNSLSCSAQRS